MSDSPARISAVPAHLGWRLLALVYDTVISIAFLFMVSALSLAVKPDHRPVEPGTPAALLVFIAIWAVIGAYAVLSWRRGGQTIGMKPWRLQVVNAEGTQPAWRALLIRYAVTSLSLGTVLLWCLFDGQRRGLHDLAAGTLLVRRRT
ncbi:RDD family protein [Arenimonas sp. GDDSR-1]|uniref:RDD family protein n=1 Tax=Arenimonas sp. GDDSR-1 TaxID=2950125 RepID=UPI00261A23A3|nr:RDD family protein [Arenimonas sp. GDDSR-1]